MGVHDQPTGFAPIGTALAIGPRLALTCAHVVLDNSGKQTSPLFVSFPNVPAAWKRRWEVRQVELDVDDWQVADVALLHLAEDAPPGAQPPRLRLLEPGALVGRRWWAFGFPGGNRHGNEADGTVGAPLANGWVRLDTGSRFPVERGFSGGGLWLPDYQAVAGIVGRALVSAQQEGDAQALTLAQADVFLPDAKLRVLSGWSPPDAGHAAMAAWGWRLDTDPEAGQHWRPRGRGVMTDHDPGFRFTGRRAALRQIVAWLDRDATDRRVLVVTGSPGVGKSAVLGRVVTTADPALRAQLPSGDTAVRASVGSVGCAVHVKGKTALDVAAEIARAVGVALPERIEDLLSAVQERLAAEPGHRLNIVIDAIDEASSPADARLVLARVVLPLVQACGDAGVQVVCGSRRGDAAGELLSALAGAAVEIDLDDPAYFDLVDLETYTLASLRLLGAERPGNPYMDATTATPVARRIALLAEPNFLIAGLEARRRGLYDDVAAHPSTLTLTATVDATLHAYLERLPAVDGVAARELLTALAYAEAPGWSSELWHTATVALGCGVGAVQLDRFARTAAAAFLIETSGNRDASVFRLFHQALNDALLRGRGPGGMQLDELQITTAFRRLGASTDWADVDTYLLRSLAGHADRAGRIDDLLADDDYLLHADLLRLLRPANRATTEHGRQRARLLHLTLPAVSAGPAERAAMFSITQVLEQLPAMIPRTAAPYRGRWAVARRRTEVRELHGHSGPVYAVCAVPVDNHALLATAGKDGTARLWDPATGTELRRLAPYPGTLQAMCSVPVNGRTYLATASKDGTVRLWDPDTGTVVRQLTPNPAASQAMCAIQVDGHDLLATAGVGKIVQLFDPATGMELRRSDGPSWRVRAMCALLVNGRIQLAIAGDNAVEFWNPAADTRLRRSASPDGAWSLFLQDLSTVWLDPFAPRPTLQAMCVMPVDGRHLVATVLSTGTVELWDPATGKKLPRPVDPVPPSHPRDPFQRPPAVKARKAACAVPVDGKTLLAITGTAGRVQLWDPAAGVQGRQIARHIGSVDAVCTVAVDGQTLLATAGSDRAVRLWDLDSAAGRGQPAHRSGSMEAVCTVPFDGRAALATAGPAVRLWDLATGAELRRLAHRTGRVHAVCTVPVNGEALLVTAGSDRTVRLWNPSTGTELHQLTRHTRPVRTMCTLTVGGQSLLATATDAGIVRLWHPATGELQHEIAGSPGHLEAMCAMPAGDSTFVVTAGEIGTVHIWDVAGSPRVRHLTGNTGLVYAMCPVPANGRTLLAISSENVFAGPGSRTAVRLWDPVTGAELRRFSGHAGTVKAMCALRIEGRTVLATAGDDRTVRIWDVESGRILAVIPVYHAATDCTSTATGLAVLLDAGLLVIDLGALPSTKR
ncbi:hypothetical protein GCM10027610_059860 [Dactylosporangium cerinum]